jgi:hypothetical protein
MGIYPKSRKFAGYRKCDICGKTVSARGMGGHKKLKHGITRVITRVVTQVNNTSTQVINSSNNTGKEATQVKVITQDLADISGKDLAECKRPDGKHFYTDLDIRILLAKIIVETYQPRSEVALFNQFNIQDLIEDFEHRFKCSFDEVRQANKHIRTGKTLQEHRAFAEKYAHLVYSNHNEKKTFNFIEGADDMGRYQCKNCGCWLMPYSWFEEKGYGHSSPVCINGERHEFSI